MAVHRGAHEDEFQVRSLHHDIFQDGQQEVRLDAALVDLGGGCQCCNIEAGKESLQTVRLI